MRYHVIDYTRLDLVAGKPMDNANGQGRRHRPTISDVAQRAGVSTITVSRVLNNSGYVSAATRTAVERAITDLGYVPRAGARSLRSGRSETISLIVPDIANPFWSQIIAGVQDYLRTKSLSVILGAVYDDPAEESHHLERALAQNVDGFIVTPSGDESPIVREILRRDLPCVVLDRSGFPADTVMGDSVQGGHDLTELLLDLGHRRIALANGPRDISTSRDRFRGYGLALAHAGLSVDERFVLWGPYTDTWGAEVAEGLLQLSEPPTAILAANNSLALGVMKTLEGDGIAVPGDVALVCFDEVPAPIQPVTVAAQPAYEMGWLAAEMLVQRIQGYDGPPRQVVMPCEIRVRQSSGQPLEEKALR